MTTYGIHFPPVTSDRDPDYMFRCAKEAGFDAALLTLDCPDTPNEKVVESCRKAGLFTENMHMTPFKLSNSIWIEDERGDLFLSQLLDNIETAHRFEIPTVVVHSNSKNPPSDVSNIGIQRFGIALERCEKYGINMAVENIRSVKHLCYIFEHLDSPRLKLCYDSGHENCFTHTKTVLPLFAHKLGALHLHDNDGADDHDQHLIPFELQSPTSVDWDYVCSYLEKYDGCISLEVGLKRCSPEEYPDFFRRSYAAVCKIRPK